jgi:hypothetical protein
MEKRLLVDELYRYLISLRDSLKEHGAADAAERVNHVSLFVSGSTSELYGEARLLLPQIARECGALLTEDERKHLEETIAGIEGEFERIGGG